MITSFLSYRYFAQGTPASFALAAYGRFFDAKDSRQPSTAARETVMAMVDIMSKSYANTATDTARRILGPDFIGEDRGGARLMMQQLREVLLDFLQGAMIEETEFSLLERKHTISLGVNLLPNFSVSFNCNVTCIAISLCFVLSFGTPRHLWCGSRWRRTA